MPGGTLVCALVVGDSSEELGWARSLGARTCLVNSDAKPDAKADFMVQRLADLPSLLKDPKK